MSRYVFKDKDELKRAIKLYFNEYENYEKKVLPYGRIKDWDVSNIRDMSFLFKGIINCDAQFSEIQYWKPINVEMMSSMFQNCYTFNQPLNHWGPYLSNVVSMTSMFENCSTFNQPLDNWGPYLRNDLKTHKMFNGCSKFNQNLTSWNLKDTTNMFEWAYQMRLENHPTVSLQNYVNYEQFYTFYFGKKYIAPREVRTRDLSVNSRMLYQLSYRSRLVSEKD